MDWCWDGVGVEMGLGWDGFGLGLGWGWDGFGVGLGLGFGTPSLIQIRSKLAHIRTSCTAVGWLGDWWVVKARSLGLPFGAKCGNAPPSSQERSLLSSLVDMEETKYFLAT